MKKKKFWKPLKTVRNPREGAPQGLSGFRGTYYYINIYTNYKVYALRKDKEI